MRLHQPDVSRTNFGHKQTRLRRADLRTRIRPHCAVRPARSNSGTIPVSERRDHKSAQQRVRGKDIGASRAARGNGTDGGRTHRRVRVTTSSCDTRPVSTGTCASGKSLWRPIVGSCSTTGGAASRATQRNRTRTTPPTKNKNTGRKSQAQESAERRPITRARHRITHLISFQIHYDKIHAQRAVERVLDNVSVALCSNMISTRHL